MPLISDEIVRFVPESDPDEWINLKKELSSGEDDAAWEAAAIASNGRLGDLRATIALNRMRLKASVVRWSYIRGGVPLEVTEENIALLDRRTRDELIREVNRLNPFLLPVIPRVNKPVFSPISITEEDSPEA